MRSWGQHILDLGFIAKLVHDACNQLAHTKAGRLVLGVRELQQVLQVGSHTHARARQSMEGTTAFVQPGAAKYHTCINAARNWALGLMPVSTSTTPGVLATLATNSTMNAATRSTAGSRRYTARTRSVAAKKAAMNWPSDLSVSVWLWRSL